MPRLTGAFREKTAGCISRTRPGRKPQTYRRTGQTRDDRRVSAHHKYSAEREKGEAMKRKKRVTDAVLAANRGNALSSSGPRTERGKSNASHNALRHGILAKRVVLETDEERAEYEKLVQSWDAEFNPKGVLENFLVEEVVTINWRLQISLGLETRELSRRQDERDQVDGVFHSKLALPISDWDLPLSGGWECERLVVRAAAGKDETNSSASRGPGVFQNQVVREFQKSGNHASQEAGHLEVEAVLGSSLANMTRYQAALKRDFYRAIDKLCTLQTERRRREAEQNGGSNLAKRTQ